MDRVAVVEFLAEPRGREYIVAHIDIHPRAGQSAIVIAWYAVARARAALRTRGLRVKGHYHTNAKWAQRV